MIDSVICAELPDKTLFPKLYDVVTRFMVHGPCGDRMKSCPCMKNGVCSKFYPRKFSSATIFDQNGYPLYRRRDTGVVVEKKGIELDNRSVVPYNPVLIMKYQAHVNIEFCNKGNCIKYLFKYMHKGVDRVTATLRDNDDGFFDEIKQYYDCRYLSPSEYVWRIFGFDIHHRWPSVQRLTFHLEGQQSVIFNDKERLDEVLDKVKKRDTMFLAWMEANKKFELGRSLTYSQFPSLFVYDADLRQWKVRQRAESVGRLTFVPPSTRELYYLRLLLNVQVGCTSYEDIKRVGDRQCLTFREACSELGLFADDKEFIDGINEIALLGSGPAIRWSFVRCLLANSMSDPLRVWNQTWELLSDGIQYQRRHQLNKPRTFLLFSVIIL
jgi:hypothetical protein